MKHTDPLPPSLDRAPAENIALVYRNDGTEHFSPSKQLRAGKELERKRTLVGEIGSKATLSEVESAEQTPDSPSTWDELIDNTSQWIDEYLEGRNFDGYAESNGVSPEAGKAHVRKVAVDGVRTTGAFLEVIPRVLANQGQHLSEQEIAETASRSQSFILEWTKVDDIADGPLAASLKSPEAGKVDRQSGRFDFTNLRFDPKWFTVVDNKVVVNTDLEEELTYISTKNPRNSIYPSKETVRHLVDVKDPSKKELFGCPGRHMVPYIYKKMVETALEAGLFEQTYDAERESQDVRELVTA